MANVRFYSLYLLVPYRKVGIGDCFNRRWTGTNAGIRLRKGKFLQPNQARECFISTIISYPNLTLIELTTFYPLALGLSSIMVFSLLRGFFQGRQEATGALDPENGSVEVSDPPGWPKARIPSYGPLDPNDTEDEGHILSV
jgi:hypothetical protein